MNADDFVGGHSILALERFMDETRHMIIFDVLSWKSPVGEKGERLRLFLPLHWTSFPRKQHLFPLRISAWSRRMTGWRKSAVAPKRLRKSGST